MYVCIYALYRVLRNEKRTYSKLSGNYLMEKTRSGFGKISNDMIGFFFVKSENY